MSLIAIASGVVLAGPAVAVPILSAAYIGTPCPAGALGDFNQDGHMDLAGSDQARDLACVQLGVGDGTFAPPLWLPTQSSPRGVATGDFDGDGNLDLAVVSDGTNELLQPDPGAVSVFLGRGDGTFAPRADVVVGDRFRGVATGDLNRDGFTDLVVTDVTKGALQVFLGRTDGSLVALDGPTTAPACAVVALQDLDGDGALDAVALDPTNSVALISRGSGDGALGPTVAFPTGRGPTGVASADFDGDGVADLAVSAGGTNPGVASILHGNGDLTFGGPLDFFAGPQPLGIATADFNEDGHADLAVALVGGGQQRHSILLGTGDGRFGDPSFGGLQDATHGVITGRVDGDAHADVVLRRPIGSVILLGQGDGSFGKTVNYLGNPSYRMSMAVALGDLAGTPAPDLAVAGEGTGISVLSGVGDGTFGPPVLVPGGTETSSAVRIGDLNLDGVADVVWADRTNTLSVCLGDGRGALGPRVPHGTAAGPVSIAIADLNRDGLPDLVAACRLSYENPEQPGTISVLLGKGDGAFWPRTDFAAGMNPKSVTVGDLNGDGAPDLLVTCFGYSGELAILLGNGDGSFGAARMQGDATDGVRSGTLADVDEDGHLDAISAVSNGIRIHPGIGDGTFALPTKIGMHEPIWDAAAFDLDHDGHVDLLVAAGDMVAVMLGSGSMDYMESTNYGVGYKVLNVNTGDVNGDGVPDVITANQSSTVAVLLQNGPSTPPTLAFVDWMIGPENQVILRWQASNASSLQCAVQRQAADGSWTPLGAPRVEGSDLLVYEDAGLPPGPYRYRLDWWDGGTERWSDPIAVEVPSAAGVSLGGFRPNPAGAGAVIVFRLPDAQRARLEVVDVRGRTVYAQSVADPVAGEHVLPLSALPPLKPGVYWLRIVRSDGAIWSKGVIKG